MYNVSNLRSHNKVHFCAANFAFKLRLTICPPTDAESGCNPEVNPLTLDPPEIIGEYGTSVIINCTSSEEDLDEMYWKIGDTFSDREEENHFLSWILPLSDWNLKAKCQIMLNETFKCSKDLNIVIYSMYNYK